MSKQLWTPEEVIDRIRLLYNSGNDLSHGKTVEVAPKLVAAAIRYFGNWRRAVEEAGIDYAAFATAARQRALTNRAKWSKERIVECIQKAAEMNESLQPSVVSRTRQDLYASARGYFGTWALALEAAGILYKPSNPGKPGEHTALLNKWKDELLLEKLCQYADRDRHIDERHVRLLAPALHEALISRYGSWMAVLAASESVIEPKCKLRLDQDD